MEAESAAAAVVGGGGGVRVVARICAPAGAATTNPAAAFQVGATRGGSHPRSSDAAALLSFTAATPSSSSSSSSSQGRAPNPRKEEHVLDWCYLQHETDHHVFLNEVSPLIHHLLGAAGCSNACVVTFGKGSQDQPGLVSMAVKEILEFSKGAVRISSYQVLQDTHIFDLLEHKDQEILILEDAQGRTHLKGLSKVQVKSIEEFDQLHPRGHQGLQNKQPLHPRGHQGLIIHISSFDQEGRECAVAKMNFLNLTDYVDPKQKKNDGAAAVSNSNKSMYTMMNVVQALNSNQSFVPYRESKVTRILQDSLCKTSGAVLIACLEEISCPDTVSTISLAARSSQVANEQYRRSMSVSSSKRPNVNLSNAKSSSRYNSTVKAWRTPVSNKRPQPIMRSEKKTECSLSTLIKMKQKDAKPTMGGRSQLITCSTSSLSTSIKTKQKDAKPKTSESTFLCPSTISSKEDALVVVPTAEVEEVQSSREMETHAPSNDEVLWSQDNSSSDLDAVSSCTDIDVQSPKLSERLREIANTLKELSARPLSISTQQVGMEAPQKVDVLEPKTPAVHLKFEQTENPSKKSVLQECLTFLNSATKEQLKSLKGIGPKRANHIVELRESSPEPFKGVDDIRCIIGLNNTELENLMSGISGISLECKTEEVMKRASSTRAAQAQQSF